MVPIASSNVDAKYGARVSLAIPVTVWFWQEYSLENAALRRLFSPSQLN